jgi:vacuolar-type H+-ATPase subunit H
VALSTSITGNVSYYKQDIGQAQADTGSLTQRWETTKITRDLEEHERAKKIRSKVTSLLRSVCSTSKFGLLCPESNRAELLDMVRTARQLAIDFNARTNMTRVGVYIMMGRVAADDVEAVRAINSEVEGLLRNMVEGARALDPAAIREAANKARQLSAMLTEEASSKVRDAIDTARRVARDIVKSAERAEVVIDELALAKIGNTRLAFLDMDAPDVSSVEAKPQAAALELPAWWEEEVGFSKARAPQLDWEA